MSAPRVVVAATQSPFLTGGAERHVDRLVEELVRRGVDAEKVTLPFFENTHFEVVKSALAWRLGDFSRFAGRKVDALIATRFPSYLAVHPKKVVWLIHQYRQVYDQFATPYSDFTSTAEDRAIREMIHRMDATGLAEARRIYANSANVAARLRKHNGLKSEPLYHPPPQVGRYRSGPAGDYAFWAGRFEKWKRPQLAVGALAEAKRARLKLAGDGPERKALERYARSLGVSDRCEFLGRVDDAAMIELFAGARAVLVTAADEDYGYVPLEAFLSGKAVFTVRDAGGPLEFVEHGKTGFVAEPSPEALGRILDERWDSLEALSAMALSGKRAVEKITWDDVCRALLAGAGL